MNDDTYIDTTKETPEQAELRSLKTHRAAYQTSLSRIEGRNPRVVAGERRNLQEIEARMKELDADSLKEPAKSVAKK